MRRMIEIRNEHLARIRKAGELRSQGCPEDALNELLELLRIRQTLHDMFKDVLLSLYVELARVYVEIEDYHAARPVILDALGLSFMVYLRDTEQTYYFHKTARTVITQTDGTEEYLRRMDEYVRRAAKCNNIDFTARVQVLAEMGLECEDMERYDTAAKHCAQAVKVLEAGVRCRGTVFDTLSHFPPEKEERWVNELHIRLFRVSWGAAKHHHAEAYLLKLSRTYNRRALGPELCRRSLFMMSAYTLERDRWHEAMCYAIQSAIVSSWLDDASRLEIRQHMRKILLAMPMN